MMVTGERRYLDCVCAHESIAEGIEESHNYDSMSNVMLSAVGVVDVSMYSDNVVSCWNLRGGVMMGGKLDLGLIGGLYGEEEGEGWGIGGIVVRTLVCRYEQWWGVSMCQYTVRDLVDDSHCEDYQYLRKTEGSTWEFRNAREIQMSVQRSGETDGGVSSLGKNGVDVWLLESAVSDHSHQFLQGGNYMGR
ncbi:hypothetical protein Tco_1313899 [Tanacetum coccineum]